jgi:hypothetical protein
LRLSFFTTVSSNRGNCRNGATPSADPPVATNLSDTFRALNGTAYKPICHQAF